jgi:hypothetical protein
MMKIGYEGYSLGNSGIADRRRILFWANARGHTVVDSRDPNADVIVITSSSDLGYWSRSKTEKPLILDVVDGLIGEQSWSKDLLRGVAYWGTRRSTNIFPLPYKELITGLARRCTAVVCSSPEQVAEWEKYQIKAIDILDIHEEIPIKMKTESPYLGNLEEIFWEGLPATLGSMSLLKGFVEDNSDFNFNLNILTSLNSFKYMNKYKRFNLEETLTKQLPQKNLKFNFVQWSPQELVHYSQKSKVGVIPILGFQGYNHLKAENRLLIMWRLGLPVLTSPLASYSRVMKDAQIDGICRDSLEWKSKLENLFRSSDLREEFATKSSEYLEKRHNYKELLDKWDSVLAKT